jgi:hypothetical protein
MTVVKNPALQSEALYAKSQAYIAKGIRSKSSNELDEYQLWASLAIELLAKSSLSTIHPTLIADPTHYQSLFAACGYQISPDIKTITAKTLFQRLGHVSKKFDHRVQNFCEQLSLRRNAEIHSGESPFLGVKAEVWESKYWHAAEVILEIQSRGLEDWLGVSFYETPQKILSETKLAINMAVQTRIAHLQQDFNSAHRNKDEKIKFIKERQCAHPYDYWRDFDIHLDGFELQACPACSANGVIAGSLWSEEVSDELDENDPFIEFVDKTYATEEFLCKVCGLRLSGAKEIEAAGVLEEFYEREVREREFEPDYGND